MSKKIEDPKPEDTIDDLDNAGPQDDADDPDDDDTDDPDVKKTGPEPDEPKGSFTKADIDKAAKRRQAALDRARQAEKELADLKKVHATQEEKLKLEAAEEASRQAEDVYKPAIVRKHMFYEMASLGLEKDQIPDLVDLVKMDKIEVDDEFNVEGVEEEVARIRQKFPRLFPDPEKDPDPKTPVKKQRVPKADGAPKPPPEKPKTARDVIVSRLRGNAS